MAQSKYSQMVWIILFAFCCMLAVAAIMHMLSFWGAVRVEGMAENNMNYLGAVIIVDALIILGLIYCWRKLHTSA